MAVIADQFVNPAHGRWRGGGAVFSDDYKHRFRLWRHWGAARQGPHGVFVMLNPSTADGMEDDATIRRCVNYGKREGWTGLEVVNLFSYRSTDPKTLRTMPYQDLVAAGKNTEVVVDVCAAYGQIVLAWGENGGRYPAHVHDYLTFLSRLHKPLYAFAGTTKSMQPPHPLRLPKALPLVLWSGPRVTAEDVAAE